MWRCSCVLHNCIAHASSFRRRRCILQTLCGSPLRRLEYSQLNPTIPCNEAGIMVLPIYHAAVKGIIGVGALHIKPFFLSVSTQHVACPCWFCSERIQTPTSQTTTRRHYIHRFTVRGVYHHHRTRYDDCNIRTPAAGTLKGRIINGGQKI